MATPRPYRSNISCNIIAKKVTTSSLFYIVPCTPGQLRLMGGSLPNEGRVEICIDIAWGTVCDDHWDNTDSTVVCQQLGYSTQGQ